MIEKISLYGGVRIWFMVLLVINGQKVMLRVSLASDAINSICAWKKLFRMETVKLYVICIHIFAILCYTNFGKELMLEVGTAARNVWDVYLDCTPVLRTVKKWFGRFQNGDLILDGLYVYD